MTEPTKRVPAVPRIISGLSIVIIAIGVWMMLAGARAIGTAWDEGVHVKHLQTFFATGWSVSPDALINGQPDPSYYYGFYLYGPIPMLFGHAINTVLGFEEWGSPVATYDAYTGRHLGIAIMGIMAVAAVIGTVRLITRSWTWGLVSGAVLAATPLWTGHAMMNIKDSPTAGGFAIAILGLVALTRQDYAESWKLRATAITSLALGTLISMGTRSSMLFALAACAFVTVAAMALWNWASPKEYARFPRVWQRIAEGTLGALLAYGAMLAIYPNAYRNPFTLLKESMASSAHFPVTDPVLTGGTLLEQPVPWFYLPVWFGAQLPLLVLLFCAAFVLAWLVVLVRHFAVRGRLLGDHEWLVMAVPVLGQAFLMYVIAVSQHSVIYNGSRQFLFMVPAFTTLAVLGIWLAAGRLAGAKESRRWWRIALWALVGVGLVLPTIDQIRLYPYNYVYFNEIAALRLIDNNWATDYWRTSSLELTRRLPAEGAESCTIVTSLADVQPCAQQMQFEPFWDMRGTQALPGTLTEGQYWFMRDNNGDTTMPPGCVLHDAITRPLKFQELTIGQILRCSTTG